MTDKVSVIIFKNIYIRKPLHYKNVIGEFFWMYKKNGNLINFRRLNRFLKLFNISSIPVTLLFFFFCFRRSSIEYD